MHTTKRFLHLTYLSPNTNSAFAWKRSRNDEWYLREFMCRSIIFPEESWKIADENYDSFQYNSMLFYNNIYDVLVNNAELVVKPDQVRRQIAAIEECHRQNPLPKRNK